MSQVFISYAREDQLHAERLAAALEGHGWSVWWDRSIPAGKNYDEVIERALAEAACVLVLWSDDSVGSSWVRAEAGEGHRREVLLPVLLGDVEIPLAFRQLQAVRLAGWKGDLEDREFQKLVSAISRILDSEPVRLPVARRSLSRRAVYVALAMLPVAAAGGYYSLTEPAMVEIPAGPFQSGTSSGQESWARSLLTQAGVEEPCLADEQERSHSLDSFYIDRREVTLDEYRRYLDREGDPAPVSLASAPDDHPVTGIQWEEARRYCKDHGGKSLPTGAQWEKAARGETERVYPWGDLPVDASRTNYCNAGCLPAETGQEDDGFPTTAPVGRYPAGRSPYGLDDMAGNAAEWVEDAYEGKCRAARPANGEPEESRVVRGGSWNSAPAFLRTAYIGFAPPQTRSPEIGFRCAAEHSIGRRWRFSQGG